MQLHYKTKYEYCTNGNEQTMSDTHAYALIGEYHYFIKNNNEGVSLFHEKQ